MTTALNGDLCRISVEGPDKRVDLAVPLTTTVAALLPVLLHHTAVGKLDLTRPEESWVLQRMGGRPFDPAGTPESLDWLEGERLYLRPVENQLPEMHFDDISEGIAETVNERRDRWQPEYRRPLFIGVSAAVVLLLTTILQVAPPVLRAAAGFGLAAGLLVTAVLYARNLADRALSTLFGLSAITIAGITVAGVAGSAAGLAAGCGAAAGVALLLVVVQRMWAPSLLYPVYLTVAVLGLVVDGVLGLRAMGGMDAAAAAAVGAALLFATVLFAPNLVLRAGRLRGPQLPRTGRELQYDIEPYPAEEMQRRADTAQNYLSVLVVCVSVALPVLWTVILPAGGWASWALPAVLTVGLLLRARVLLNVWQRVALTAGGGAGVVMLLLAAAAVATPGWLIALLLALLVLLLVTVLAAMRPWPRRLLPIWEFTATVFDVIVGLAVLPITLQLTHMYAWARGLFG
ncbi:type VII secretion integral membrane protein EccD [Actinoplanes sp. NPDC026670]|uniref:type VII secretion integral membrane protein EccD n=1 Tax=Actinoplanes sp. NPDC026670 TaxID=3154700 RepID=UPI0033D7F02D